MTDWVAVTAVISGQMVGTGVGAAIGGLIVKPYKKKKAKVAGATFAQQVWPAVTQQAQMSTSGNIGGFMPISSTGTYTNTSSLTGMYLPRTYKAEVRLRPTPEEVLPREVQAEPIVAYKRAKIAANPLRLFGVGMNASYGPDDTAECLKQAVGDHDAPFAGCSCGFYAMPKEELGVLGAEYDGAVADLEVELFGKIVQHRRGWRAERQRVLGVYMDPVCFACSRSADLLVVFDKDDETFAMPDMVRPVCGWHSGGFRPITVTDMANEWGVEVTWGNLPF